MNVNALPPATPAPASTDLKTVATSWAVSILFHVALLIVFAMVSWVVLRPSSPDVLFNLGAPVAGIGSGLEPGGGSPRPASGHEAPARSRSALPQAPASGLQKALDMSLPMAPVGLASGTGDPSRTLLQGLAGGSESGGEVGGRGLGGIGKGTGAGFGDYISGLGGTGLDVVLILDATDSMEPFIESAKARLHDIMDVITKLVPGTRFGVVAYKDYGDEYGSHAVQSLPLTDELMAVRQFINQIVVGGGGDFPEPIHEALKAATDHKDMKWGDRRKKVVILVGDSSIHSTGRKAAYEAATDFARAGGTINVIDVGGADAKKIQRNTVQPDLQVIAQKGKGSAFLLGDSKGFWRDLITSVFDPRYKQDVETIIDECVKDKG